MDVTEKAKVLPNPSVYREQCVEKCVGCNRMYSDENIGDVCISYSYPAAVQRLGCPMQSNKEVEKKNIKKVNPIKASKRSRRRGVR